jgi:L-arabinose isomerase
MHQLTDALAQAEVWFVTGSVSLYGEDSLREVARQSREVVAELNASIDVPIRIVWKPVVADTEQIGRVLAEADANDEVVGVIAWMHTFSPAKMWVRGLYGLRTPLLHFATQANVRLPWRTVDFDFLNLNQSAHGDREFAHGATRAGASRATVVGHASDPAVAARIGRWQRAAAGRAALDGLRIARFGDNMRHVAVTDGDKVEAEKVFGIQVNAWGVTELAEVVRRAPSDAVDEVLADYDANYDVAAGLRPGGDRRQALRDAAAIEVGLRSFLDDGGFHAFTTTFEDLGALHQLPGLAPQRLQQEGYGFGPEGDWKTAALIRAAAVMGAGRPGGASIMED